MPAQPMVPIESIKPIPPLPVDSTLFSYEWDVFEQSLEWAFQDSMVQGSLSHQDSLDWLSESVLSTSPSSPADSYFSSYSHSQSQEPVSPASNASNSKLPLPKQPLSKKSTPRRRQQSLESRARRRSQNREAQRAFRCRKQQHIEEMEVELRTMTGKYDGLRERYENLSKLYMDLLKQRGTSAGEGAAVLPNWTPESGGSLDPGVDNGEAMDVGKIGEFGVSELLFGAEMETVGV